MKRNLKNLVALFGLCCSTAALAQTEVQIDPKATYLRNNQDPSAANAAAIDLESLGILPGYVIRLQRVGSYQSTVGIPGAAQTSMVGAFARTNALGAPSILNRISTPVDAGSDVSTQSTYYGFFPTNIWEDFSISDTQVVVPHQAKFLFVSANDRHFGDNVSNGYTLRLTVINSGFVITEDTKIDADDFTMDGANIIVQGATLTISGAHTFYSLRVTSNGVVTHKAPPLDNNWMHLTILTDCTVDQGSTIHANGKGHPARTGPGGGLGSTSDVYCSGGGHGGLGGSGLFHAAREQVYGSLTEPNHLGSGGGGPGGGAGGGIVRLTVGGVLRVDGAISASGGNPTAGHSGGGAGGSIWIRADSMAGSGIISANGSGAWDNHSGGGGGGRIALYSRLGTNSVVTRAHGGNGTNAGTYGAGGTVYSKRDDEQRGSLVIENASTNASATPLIDLPPLNTLYLAANGKITHYKNGEFFNHSLNLVIQGDLIVAPTASINVDARGFAPRSGPGRGLGDPADYYCGGATHGGVGGYGLNFGRNMVQYGSVSAPDQPGSGGGGPSGGWGGGVIRLQVGGTIVLDGTISANGGSPSLNHSGGGAGGSIWISCSDLHGQGLIRSDGGGAWDNHSGGGGAGRISILTGSPIVGVSLRANGGSGTNSGEHGGGGTILVKVGNQNHGDLTVNSGANGAPTMIPAGSTFDNVIVGQYGWLSHAPNFDQDINKLLLNVTNNLTVNVGGRIDVSGHGYGPRLGPGKGLGSTATGQAGGGGHGGRGGDGSLGAGGEPYGNPGAPTQSGSGGGGPTPGSGGGVIRLNVGGVLRNDGFIRANGSNYYQHHDTYSGGGAGGSIWISASRLEGAGEISAVGGIAGRFAGGGGGGRILILAASNLFEASNVLVYGGGYSYSGSNGAPGTISTGAGVQPIGFLVAQGFELNGGLAELLSADDQRLEMFNDETALACEVEVWGTSPVAAAGQVNVTVEMSVGRPGLSYALFARNYQTNAWTILGGGVATLQDERVTKTISTNASNYIQSGSLQTRVRLLWTVLNDEDPTQDGWLHSLDEVSWLIF